MDTPILLQLTHLPDNVVLNVFRFLSLGDLIAVDATENAKLQRLVGFVFENKRSIAVPDDLFSLNAQYSFSSYWDDLGRAEMGLLVQRCSNVVELRFDRYRRMQMFLQPQIFEYFRRFPEFSHKIRKVRFGRGYVVDKTTFETLATAFPRLKVLVVEEPYPLVYKMARETVPFLQDKILNLHPAIDDLLDDNNRVTEDVKFLLDSFPELAELTLKRSVFRIKT